MIQLIGGDLFQWDVGRSVVFTPEGTDAEALHFAHQGDSKAVIMELVDSQARIPDYLLQSDKALCVYAVSAGVTFEKVILPVRKRERPENYVYEDDRRNYIYELIQAAENAVEDANTVVAELRTARDSGVFNGPQGEKGDPGEAGPQGEQGDKGDPGKDAPQESVLYIEQTLTEEQKAKALENIGAASQERVLTLEQQMADLLYKAITITAFTAKDAATSKSTLELGTKVTDVTFAWAFSKTPKTVTFNGKEMSVDSAGTTLSGLSVQSNTSWPLVAADERNTQAKGSAGLIFLRGVYYGVLKHGADIDSAAILAMDKKLQTGRTMNFTVNPGAGMRPAYALPSSGYGTPTFKIGGFEYEWEKVATFDFTNASGHTESYDVWMHSQDVTGSITINVT